MAVSIQYETLPWSSFAMRTDIFEMESMRWIKHCCFERVLRRCLLPTIILKAILDKENLADFGHVAILFVERTKHQPHHSSLLVFSLAAHFELIALFTFHPCRLFQFFTSHSTHARLNSIEPLLKHPG